MIRRGVRILFCLLVLGAPALAQENFDLIIHHGRIVDGSGNPWFLGDIGIRDGRIARLGDLSGATAPQVIDAKQRIVAPGFVDVHTHVEESIIKHPTADNFIYDGVTSIISGNCGNSKTDLAAYFGELRKTGIALNLGTLVGHNSVRRAVMGMEDRAPTPEEMAQMEALVARAMEEGAVGLSTGLIYTPGTYAQTDEVAGLAKVAARYGGLYATHMRNEGDKVLDAINEALTIGREAALPVEISHFKVSNKRFWGQSRRMLEMVEQARRQGLDVTVDQYPYTASSTSLNVLLPSWALAGGMEKLKERLNDPAMRKRIAAEMKERIRKVGGRKHLDYARVARAEWDPSLEGKTITDITREKGRRAKLEQEIETVLEMAPRGHTQMVYHGMSEEDVGRIMQYANTMIASDAGVIEMGQGKPHPRAYGTNARVLGRYAREKGLLRLEDAIRKMTSLPAQRFRIYDRGLLREGMWADIVIFDEGEVADLATFEQPHANARGLAYVLVNGQLVLAEGRHTQALPGKILYGKGWKPAPASGGAAAISVQPASLGLRASPVAIEE